MSIVKTVYEDTHRGFAETHQYQKGRSFVLSREEHQLGCNLIPISL